MVCRRSSNSAEDMCSSGPQIARDWEPEGRLSLLLDWAGFVGDAPNITPANKMATIRSVMEWDLLRGEFMGIYTSFDPMRESKEFVQNSLSPRNNILGVR